MRWGAILLLVVAACDRPDTPDACQYACDYSYGPGLRGVMCEPAIRCTWREPGFMGDCACTTDGSCGEGQQPWSPDPAPLTTVCR